jgi:hypothetical protein
MHTRIVGFENVDRCDIARTLQERTAYWCEFMVFDVCAPLWKQIGICKRWFRLASAHRLAETVRVGHVFA